MVTTIFLILISVLTTWFISSKIYYEKAKQIAYETIKKEDVDRSNYISILENSIDNQNQEINKLKEELTEKYDLLKTTHDCYILSNIILINKLTHYKKYFNVTKQSTVFGYSFQITYKNQRICIEISEEQFNLLNCPLDNSRAIAFYNPIDVLHCFDKYFDKKQQ